MLCVVFPAAWALFNVVFTLCPTPGIPARNTRSQAWHPHVMCRLSRSMGLVQCRFYLVSDSWNPSQEHQESGLASACYVSSFPQHGPCSMSFLPCVRLLESQPGTPGVRPGIRMLCVVFPAAWALFSVVFTLCPTPGIPPFVYPVLCSASSSSSSSELSGEYAPLGMTK